MRKLRKEIHVHVHVVTFHPAHLSPFSAPSAITNWSGGECLQTRPRDMKWPGPPSKAARPGILVLRPPSVIMSDPHGDRDSPGQPKSAKSAFGALRTGKNVVHV